MAPSRRGAILLTILLGFGAVVLIGAGFCTTLDLFRSGDPAPDAPDAPASITPPLIAIPAPTQTAPAHPMSTPTGALRAYYERVSTFDLRPGISDPEWQRAYDESLIAEFRMRTTGPALSELMRVSEYERPIYSDEAEYLLMQSVTVRSMDVVRRSGPDVVVRVDVVLNQHFSDGVGGVFPRFRNVIVDFGLQLGTDALWRISGWNIIRDDGV